MGDVGQVHTWLYAAPGGLDAWRLQGFVGPVHLETPDRLFALHPNASHLRIQAMDGRIQATVMFKPSDLPHPITPCYLAHTAACLPRGQGSVPCAVDLPNAPEAS